MTTLRRDFTRPIVAFLGLIYLVGAGYALIALEVSPEMVLIVTAGCALFLVIGLRPLLGIHVLVMIMYVENNITLGGDLTGMKLLGAVILVGWLMNAALGRRLDVALGPTVFFMTLFVVWCAVSLVSANSVPVGAVRVFTYVQLATSAVMVSAVVNDLDKMKRVFGGIVIWAFLSTVIALIQYFAGLTRVAAGLVGNRNGLATFIVGALVCAYLLYQLSIPAWQRLFILCSLPVFFLGLALTFSRTGVIVLGLCLLLIWYRVVRERGFLILFGSLGVIIVLAMFLPERFYDRVASIAPAMQNQGDTFGLRVRLWKLGLRMIEDRPLVGVGPGNFMVATKRYAHGEDYEHMLVPHNTFVGLAAEQGLVGLALFVAMGAFAWRETRHALRVGTQFRNKELQFFAALVEATLLLVAVVGLSGNLETMKYLWVFIGLAIRLGQIARNERPAPLPDGA